LDRRGNDNNLITFPSCPHIQLPEKGSFFNHPFFLLTIKVWARGEKIIINAGRKVLFIPPLALTYHKAIYKPAGVNY
jgi:hypothetical protein